MRIGRISLPRVRLSAEYRESTKFSANYAEFACLSWSQNELCEICVIRTLAQYTPCPKEGRENGANCVEFARLYLTQNELCETRVIRCSLGSLPGPEKVPLLVWIARNLHHSWMLSANGAKFAQFVSNSLYLSTKD